MTPRRWLVVGLVVLCAWTASVAIWAVRPEVDAVPTGKVDGVQTFEHVECASPLSGSSGPADPLPVLDASRAYERAACTQLHDEARKVLVFDVVGLVLIALGVAWAWRATTAEQLAPANP